MNSTWDHLIKNDIKRRLVISAAALGLLFSCATSSGTPDWLTSYPSDSAYYIGIGGSNTGNLAEDREKAAASARTDLAAQISTQVKSELDIASMASSDGDFSESVKQTISESVEQNLQSVETVDTWISAEEGAWAYVRLSKATWAAIVKREVTDLTLRANTTLQPVAAGTMTETEEMAALGRARLSLLESAWGPRVKDEVFGTGGFLMEAVDGAISERVAGLTLKFVAEPAVVEYGRDVLIQGLVVSGQGRATGSYPILIVTPEGDPISLATEPSGSFSKTLPSASLGTKEISLSVTTDLGAWDIPMKGFPVSVATTSIYVAPIPVTFTVNIDAAADLISKDGDVKNWFTDLELPVSINSGGIDSIDIEFTWSVFDYPRVEGLEKAFYMCEVGANITLRRSDTILAVLDLEPIKDGGINWEQSHSRAAEVFMEDLNQSIDIAETLLDILGK